MSSFPFKPYAFFKRKIEILKQVTNLESYLNSKQFALLSTVTDVYY